MNLLFLVVILCSVNCKQKRDKEVKNTSIEKNIDSVPIQMSYQEFLKKSTDYVALFEKNTKFSEESYIEIVRMYNTISIKKLWEKSDIYEKYLDLFFKRYVEIVADLFDAQLSRGMGYYSKKYNLDIGGAAPNKNSYFEIKD